MVSNISWQRSSATPGMRNIQLGFSPGRYGKPTFR
jgi:hypothetical protein